MPAAECPCLCGPLAVPAVRLGMPAAELPSVLSRHCSEQLLRNNTLPAQEAGGWYLFKVSACLTCMHLHALPARHTTYAAHLHALPARLHAAYHTRQARPLSPDCASDAPQIPLAAFDCGGQGYAQYAQIDRLDFENVNERNSVGACPASACASCHPGILLNPVPTPAWCVSRVLLHDSCCARCCQTRAAHLTAAPCPAHLPHVQPICLTDIAFD